MTLAGGVLCCLFLATWLMVSVGATVAFFFSLKWVIDRLDDGWCRRDTTKVLAFVVSIVVAWATVDQVFRWHKQGRTNDMLVRFEKGWMLLDETGDFRFGGAFAPRNFTHGTAWCTGYKTREEGAKVFTFALASPPVVYVDVWDDGVLDAMLPAVVEEDRFPAIKAKATSRKPTAEDRLRYETLMASLQKGALAEAVEREFGEEMFPH